MNGRTARLAAALVGVACAAGGAGALAAGAAAASTSPPNLTTAANWAGYAVTKSADTHFRRVIGDWTQPSVTCHSGPRSYSAYWVGLGGMSSHSQGLEQIGSEADCSSHGQAVYSVWYEMLPDAPHSIAMHVSAGDQLTARVRVIGHQVTFRLRDLTSGASFVKVLDAPDIDVSSAEWIAEAPSDCSGSCRPLTLANFGTVTFTHSVTEADGHSGTISDPAWTATAIKLDGAGDDFGGFHPHFFGMTATGATATPTALSPAGDDFSVTYGKSSSSGSGGGSGAPGSPGSGSGTGTGTGTATGGGAGTGSGTGGGAGTGATAPGAGPGGSTGTTGTTGSTGTTGTTGASTGDGTDGSGYGGGGYGGHGGGYGGGGYGGGYGGYGGGGYGGYGGYGGGYGG